MGRHGRSNIRESLAPAERAFRESVAKQYQRNALAGVIRSRHTGSQP